MAARETINQLLDDEHETDIRYVFLKNMSKKYEEWRITPLFQNYMIIFPIALSWTGLQMWINMKKIFSLCSNSITKMLFGPKNFT